MHTIAMWNGVRSSSFVLITHYGTFHRLFTPPKLTDVHQITIMVRTTRDTIVYLRRDARGCDRVGT